MVQSEIRKWQNSEAKIKTEAVKFFDLSDEEQNKDKKVFKKRLEDFVKNQKNIEKNLVREILKAKHGLGKHCENPPKDFLSEVDCEKERRLKFLKTARDEMKCGFKYKDWCSKEFRLFDSHNETLVRKLEQEQENVSQLMKESEGIKLLRERSTGENIFDAERQVFSKNSDGTIKRSVIRETYARVTVRQKRKSVDGDSLEEISGSAQIKRAKKMSNILDHASVKDKDGKASLRAKIIDQEGEEFGANVEKKSKVMQQNKTLNPEQTSDLMTTTWGSEYMWRQSRTAFKNTLGFSPISSQRKVDLFRKKVMAVKKEDWNFLKRNIYQNKQGKSKGIPKETTVLLVKNLSSYMVKMAESESEELDLASRELPVCFDADAGGGRFLATFTFLNRNDGDVKLHPFLMFKGSDSRKNLELTFGTFTEEIRKLEGKEVMLKNEAVKIKLYGLFDLCALNCIVGKQNHSASFPCAWTNVSKEHLQSENHTGNDHTEKDCKDVRFLSIQEYETNLTHHLVRQEGKSVSKSGKEARSIIATNLCPLKDMSRYIPPSEMEKQTK